MIQAQHQVLPMQSQQQQQSQIVVPAINHPQIMNSLVQQPQQNQSHQIMPSNAAMLQQQSMCQQAQQHSIGRSPGFAHPSQSHIHNSSHCYQQASPNRPSLSRYPTPSPESVAHTPICKVFIVFHCLFK